MYMLLSGIPPFNGTTNEDIMDAIVDGHVTFSNSQWSKVSKPGIALIRKMLKYLPNSRISAKDALNDPWIKHYEEQKPTDKVAMLEGVESLRSFKVTSVMQKAVLSYIAGHAMNKEEERKLRAIFISIDKDKNGLLSLEELVEGYMLLFKGDLKAAKEEAKITMDKIDTNKNGTIDYNGTCI